MGQDTILHLAIGAAVACVWLFLTYGVYVMILGSSVISFVPSNSLLGGSWLFWFVFLLTFNSFGEEIEARAYLQTVFSRATGIRRAIVVSAVLFGMGHIPINIYVYHSSLDATVSNVAGAVMFGLAAGYLYSITGNILASISLHSVWNVLQTSLPLQISIPADLPYTSYAILSIGDVITLFIILTLLILLHKFRPSWLRKVKEES